MVLTTGDNNFAPAKWIVNPTAGLGTHTTIATALTSASSGDTIFIMPGTYTENLTLKAGVNLTANLGDGNTPNVTISGKNTFTGAGTVSISNIRLQTNSDFLLAVTGSSASIVNLFDCYLNCTNNTGISFTSSSSSSAINVRDCLGDIGTTLITLIVSTASGTATFYNTTITNSGSSTTVSSTSTAPIAIYHSEIALPFSTSSTGTIDGEHSIFPLGNTTNLTTAGTGASSLRWCRADSGTATAFSIGSGTTLKSSGCLLNSSNSTIIGGSGTLNYNNLMVQSTSVPTAAIASTVAAYTNFAGINRTFTAQPGFWAYLTNAVSNVTGDNTLYTILPDNIVFNTGTVYNSGTGTFTAPYTGVYQISVAVFVNPLLSTHTEGIIYLLANGVSYVMLNANFGTMRDITTTSVALTTSMVLPMQANATAVIQLQVRNGTKTVGVAGGQGSTSFGAWLLG